MKKPVPKKSGNSFFFFPQVWCTSFFQTLAAPFKNFLRSNRSVRSPCLHYVMKGMFFCSFIKIMMETEPE